MAGSSGKIGKSGMKQRNRGLFSKIRCRTVGTTVAISQFVPLLPHPIGVGSVATGALEAG